MRRISISVSGVSLVFPKQNFGLTSLFKKIVTIFRRRDKSEDFEALKGIDFEVLEGEVVGIIGRNGAGKSTLLRIMAGIYPPETGAVRVRGKISLLASVGVGFNKELTGRENIYLYGSIIGIPRELINQKMNEIITFSQLEDFIDAPIKTYSSGMRARLGFSVAANLDTDILLIDEVFGVGDTSFRERSKTKIFQMVKEANRTVVIVTHNSGILTQLCDRVLIIDGGEVVASGLPEDMIENYEKIVADGKGPSRKANSVNSVIGAASIQRANRMIQRGQFNEAKVLLDANLSKSTTKESARYLLGILSHTQGDSLTACKQWHHLDLSKIEIDSKLRMIGQVAKLNGDLDLAYKAAYHSLLMNTDKSWSWQILEACARDIESQEIIHDLPTELPGIFIKNRKKSVTIAKLCFNLNNFKSAALLCHAINTAQPSAKLIDLEGRAWHRLKNHEQALNCWKQLIDGENDVEKNLGRAARSSFNSGLYSQSFQMALQLHSNRKAENENLILAARSVSRSNNSDDHSKLLKIISDSDVKSRNAVLNLIKTNMEIQEWDTCLAMLGEALELHPDDTDFNVLLGRILLRTGRPGDGLINLERAFEMDPTRQDILIFIARCHIKIGDRISAIAALEKILEINPKNMNALPLLANTLSSVEDWRKSLEIWTRIQVIEPHRTDIPFKIANCHIKLNQLIKAEEILRSGMRGDSDNITGLTLLRQVYWKQSRHEDALEIFKRLLSNEPSRIDLWSNVISLSVRLSNITDSEKYLEKAEKHFSGSITGSLQLSLLFNSLHLETKTKQYLNEFMSAAKNDAGALLDAANQFYDADRADIAFILAEAVSACDSKSRKAGLIMVKIFNLLHLSGMNEINLLEQFEANEPLSLTELAVTNLLSNSSIKKYEAPALESVSFVVNSIGIGGAERQVLNTIKGFEKHLSPIPEMSLYCTKWDELDDNQSYRKFIDESKISLYTIVPESELFANAEHELTELFGESTINSIPKNPRKEIIGLYAQFKKNKPSIVHAFHDRLNVNAGIAAVLAGVPRIVVSTRSVSKHDQKGINPFKRPIWYRAAYQELLKHSSVQMYHVSQAASVSYDSWLGLQERQKTVLYNSTDYDLMTTTSSNQEFNLERRGKHIPEKAFVVGGIMRFSSEKRPLLFIETASKVIEKHPLVHFIMLGNGPLFDQAKRLVRKLDIESNIHFIGRSHQVYLWLQKMDLVLLTSQFEGLPNVLIEAQGFGKPVISTDAGGAKETFIEGQTGYLSGKDDPDSLSKLIMKVMGDPDWIKSAVKKSKANAREKFSIESAASNFVSLYSSIETKSEEINPEHQSITMPDGVENPIFVYADDRNGKAGLLSAAIRRRGRFSLMIRDVEDIPPGIKCDVYFFIDHLTFRDRDKIKARGFSQNKNVNLIPSLNELLVYDDKGAQQLEYGKYMPPAIYTTDIDDARKFLQSTKYPFISKAIEGAHSSNVRLVRDKQQAMNELEDIFSHEGRARHDKHNPGLTQQGYVLWQKFLPDNPNDWRIIMLAGKHAMIIHRQNQPDLPFASGSGLRKPENELTEQILNMLNWAKSIVEEHNLIVFAGDAILDEDGGFILVETSTTWPTIMHEENIVFTYKDGAWQKSEYDGKMIFDLKADLLVENNFKV